MAHWMIFVDACRLLLKSSLTQEEIEEVHSLLLKFNTEFKTLYPDKTLTINNHLHGHLKKTIEDFSVPHAYWLFGFERFNGVFGKYKNNNHNVELTFMKTYTNKVNLRKYLTQAWDTFHNTQENTQFGLKYATDVMNYFTNNLLVDDHAGSTGARKTYEEGQVVSEFVDFAKELFNHLATGTEILSEDVIISKKFQKVYMAQEHFKYLLEFYQMAYGDTNLTALPVIEKFKTIRLHGKIYNSIEAQSKVGSWVQVLFISQYVDSNRNESVEYWTGKILYFFRHQQNVPENPNNTATVSDDIPSGNTPSDDTPLFESKEHLFAFVRFLQPMTNQAKKYKDNGLEEWKNTFVAVNVDCIIPVSRIYSQVAVAQKPGNSGNTIVIPLQHNVHR